MKKYVLLVLLMVLLMGCSELDSTTQTSAESVSNEFKTGDIIVLQDGITVGKSVEIYFEAVEEAKTDGTINTDGVNMKSIFDGDTIKVVGEDKATKMVFIEVVEGYEVGTKWFVPKEILILASGISQ